MTLDLTTLLSCLELRQVDPDKYEGDNYPLAYPRVFGGQLLAQGIKALQLSGDTKSVKSFTFLFPREGDPATPVRYAVETVQAGRTFSTCTVTATQGDRVVGVMCASLHAQETGPERQDPAPDVSPPESGIPTDLGIVPWEVRVIDGGDLRDPTPRPAVFRFWMRASQLAGLPGANHDTVHQALLAHASDPTVIGTALLPMEGLSQQDTNVTIPTAVTSHSMWFHAPFRLHEWVLVDQHSPVLRGGRAFGRADVWTRDGLLVASLAQESMVRLT